ncbi:MAG: AAA family ATPase [Candidatus Cloacimonetes bacterium]|nr:AAA family ATPase [Candidatus Cloacimonadota bacterium]
MSQEINKYKIFENGSTWLKADFHLHTKADKEFNYDGEENYFLNNYVSKLKDQNINVGVITNHNKFDKNEFVNLRKKAKKEEILLLSGVELSVNDGSNGIHTLIVFSNQWLENGNDYINQFLNVTFEGKTPFEYEQENGRSSLNLLETIKKLNGYQRDYFLIFAHIEQNSGLFNELDGGRIQELGKNKYFRQRTLGFQKFRTNDNRLKIKNWLKDWYPAEVEGSDCKSINEIGFCGKQKDETGNEVEKETWIKIGDFTFEAVKYAFSDYQNRISAKQPDKIKHSYIKSILFEGGILDGKQIDFSPELNSLIGIRGSGKSSIIEAFRYVLNIPFSNKTIDSNYKNRLVAHTFGSGGKAIIQVIDKYGRDYRISRILNDSSEVFINGELQSGISVRETIIHKPIYFGQKDLSSTGEGFEKDLVEKLVGEKLHNIRKQIEQQKQIVFEQCNKLFNLSNVDEKIEENISKHQDAEFRLKIFKENEIQDKLQQQTDFNTDARKIKKIISDIKQFENSLTGVINQYEDDLKNHIIYKSKQNDLFFKEFFEIYKIVLNSFNNIENELKKIGKQIVTLKSQEIEFGEYKTKQADSFAEIRRKLEVSLKEQGKQLNLEEFPKLQKIIETTKQLLSSLQRESKKSSEIKIELIKSLSKLNHLWNEEYTKINKELLKVNENNSSIQIFSEFKGDKSAFLDFFKIIFKGSRIRENSFQNIVNNYSDFASIFNDFENAKMKIASSKEIFERCFFENLKELLTWQIPNKFSIEYKGKELKHHSLGQRASALILFVLSQKENDLIIIDQPEDDLDNQTIYKDVIKLIRILKPQTQFIFATHNANFPVLGDSEQIHSCRYEDEKIFLTSGSIDSPVIQQEIVDIMEGGQDAFNKRKEIYGIWKPQNL